MTDLARNINPEMLSWARKSIELSLEEAARKIGLNTTRQGSPAERLKAFESGRAEPTRNLLLKMERAYHQSLITFYMPDPPLKEDRGADFRTLPDSTKEPPLLDILLRDIRARQDMIRSILEDDEDYPRLDFVNSLSDSDSISTVIDHIRKILKIPGHDSPGIGEKSPEDLFLKLRNRVQEMGVFVILEGNLGSHQTNFSTEVFRGFAVSDDIAPFIVINPHDSKAAHSFTLIHELTHILVGATGISAKPVTDTPYTPDEHIEHFCNGRGRKIPTSPTFH